MKMKTVWIVNERNDKYSENNIYIFAKEEDAMKFYHNIIKDKENEVGYTGNGWEATWEQNGYYCSASIWEQIVR